MILRPEDPFTWASGWRSPIYCDNRLLLSYPDVRTSLKGYLADIVGNVYPETEALVGVATAGISHAALIADVMNLPMAYCRTSAKDHGRQNLLEGRIEKGTKVCVIEDLISTGKSSMTVIRYLMEEGIAVKGLVAIFSYDFAVAANDMNELGLKYYTLSDYNILVEEALSMGYIKEKDVELLKEWRKNPSEWGK